MRDAPPVQLPAGRLSFGLRFGAALPLFLAAGGLGLSALWAWQAPGWRPLVGLLLWLAYAAFAWRLARPRALARAEGTLAWDGQGWFWRAGASSGAARDSAPLQAEGLPVQADVALDLQALLLLRLIPLDPQTGPRQWLWLTPQGDPGRWRALRRALYSSGSRPAQ